VGDLGRVRGHHVLTIRGKGNVRRTVKVPLDLHRDLERWLGAAAAVGYEPGPADALLVGVRRGGRSLERRPLSVRAIHDAVVRRLVAVGCPPLGPHALRATFASLALEGGASLYRIQRALGHADPRTTERYLRGIDDLEDSAVDRVHVGRGP
jgi:integrase